MQLVRQQLRQLRHLETALVRSPDGTVIDIPALAFAVIPGDLLEIVSKHIAHADLIATVTGIGVRSHLLQRHCDLGQIRLELDVILLIQIGELLVHDVLGIDRDVHRRGGVHRIADGDRTVGRAGLLAIPFRSHEAGRTEKAVHLVFITATPEREDRQ